MPIYEFYCPDCHTIFNFFSRSVDPDKEPDCPKCGRERLSRQMSRFAISRGLAEPADSDLPDLDESKLGQALDMVSREAVGLDENDPRQAARLMQKLSKAANLDLGPGLEEALRRMEAGEDLEAIESELGDVLENDDILKPSGRKSSRSPASPPRTDQALYEL